MDKYIYLFLGLILGLLIAIYYFISREEKIEYQIRINQKMYSTKKLDETMKKIVDKINLTVKELKRELTEEEKNEIIDKCYKENF
jgi:diphthamide biosynthesis methyltransferase